MVHISPMKVTPKLGKGAQDTWRLRWLRAAGLIKPAYRDDGSGEARLWANQNGRGVYGPAFKPLQTLGRPTEEMPRFQTGPGNPAVRDYRGASGNVSHGRNVHPSCNRKRGKRKPATYSGACPISIPITAPLGLVRAGLFSLN